MTTHLAREIHEQPAAWRRAADLAPTLREVLPAPGERVAVVGCGTSWFMAQAYAHLREASGAGETDAFAASLVPRERRYDRILTISRSGTTTEVLDVVATATAPVTSVTAVADSPLAQVGAAVVLDFADERSVVQTLFATTALMLLRASLGEDVADVIAQGEAVLRGEHPVAEGVADAGQLSFLGSTWAYGVAQEAALKMREADQLWTEAYPQHEYRHGPIAIAEPGRATWILGPSIPGLAGDVAATGATLVDDAVDPVADLVRVHLLALQRAEALGLDPDHPRHLTRSVVLDPTR